MPAPELELHFQPKQLKLYNLFYAVGALTATIIGGGGAKGGGKSAGIRNIALRLITTLGKIYPGITVTIVRRVSDDLKKNHIDPLFRAYPALLPHYKASDKELILEGCGRLIFAYAETEDDVKRKFLGGYESTFIFVDEAQQFSEEELQWIATAARWTGKQGIPLGLCKVGYFFNPGGKGSAFLRRIFWTKEYTKKEKSGNYAFLHIFGWDNYEWFRGQADIEEQEFYDLDSDTRFQMFITETSEGRKYDQFPESIRMGYLLGSFDHFAGQYFAGVWDTDRHVISPQLADKIIEYWWTAWIGGDLGFGHHTAIYWAAYGKLSPEKAWEYLQICRSIGDDGRVELYEWPVDVVIFYREFLAQRMAEADIGAELVRLTPAPERKHLSKFVLGSDTKTTDRYAEHSRRELIDAITVPAGMPAIQSAQDGPGSRVISARILYELLRRTTVMRSDNLPTEKPEAKTSPLLLISSACPNLIAAIPRIQNNAEDGKPDDIRKEETIDDDCIDGAKMTAREWSNIVTIAPREVRREEFVNKGSTMQARYLKSLEFDAAERKSTVRGFRR